MAGAEQRRGRSIAMTPAEVDAFLGEERVCRIATSAPGGPHLSALWFVWHDGAVWLHSLTRSQRWTDLARDPSVAVLVDAGVEYFELRGVELRGRACVVGEVPRVGGPEDRLTEPERLFGAKYNAARSSGSDTMTYDGRHAWLRVDVDKILSWDFRKLAAVAAAKGNS